MKHLLLAIIPALFFCGASAEKMQWHDPMNETQAPVWGRAFNTETGKNYQRLPKRFKATMPTAVWNLSLKNAGIFLRFNTNSKKIWVRYILDNPNNNAGNMPPLGHSGVDLYGYDNKGSLHWLPNQMYYDFHYNKTDTALFRYDDIVIPESGTKGLDYQLYLPTYNAVKWLEVGTEKGSTFSFIQPDGQKPVVVYGSSIAQGAASSRPGNAWPNFLERMIGRTVVDLGFSGCGLMEPEVFRMLSEIDAKVFIIDAVPNSFRFYGTDTVANRLYNGIKILRAKSNAPIVVAECIVAPDNFFVSAKDGKKIWTNALQRKTFERLQKEGVKGLYYVWNSDFGMKRDYLIEGTHPNDLGNQAYADTYRKALLKFGLLNDK